MFSYNATSNNMKLVHCRG